MLASLAAATWVLGLSGASIRVPINAPGDGVMAISAIKGMLENGWYLDNPSLGFPAGQQLADFGGLNGDGLSWITLRLMGYVITDPVVLMNAFFLLGFALAGGVAYLVLRNFAVRRLTAFALAVFYANLSYHFTRGEGHLMLSMYFVVPAAVWLIVRVITGRTLIRRGSGGGLRSWLTSTNAATGLAVIAVGASTVYYAFLTLMLLLVATVLRAVAARKWRDLMPGATAFLAVSVVLFLNLLPGIAYRVANGANPDIAQRIPHESWVYSFDLTRLVLMVAGHRIDQLSNLGNKVAGGALTTGEGDILGLVLGVTFLAMLGLIAVRLIRGKGRSGPRSNLVNNVSVLAATCFLIGTTGGLGAMFAVLVAPEIRAWTRITPFLAFLCLIVLGLGVDWLRDRVDGQGWRRLASAALPVLVGAFALWDNTSPSNRPDHVANITQWRDDQTFVDRISEAMPSGSAILQLPLQPFPEAGGTVNMGDYEHLKGYVHADHLKWSYGAMKGRPGDWSGVGAMLTDDQLLIAASAAGFSGAWIDRRGFKDAGAEAELSAKALSGLKAPVAETPDRTRVFYDLRPLERRVSAALSPTQRSDLAKALTDAPVTATYGAGFYGEERDDDTWWRWATENATLRIDNKTDEARRVTWTASLRSAIGSSTQILVSGRVVEQAAFPREGSEPKVSLALTVPPDGLDVVLATTGANLGPGLGDGRPLYLQVMTPTLRDARFQEAVIALQRQKLR